MYLLDANIFLEVQLGQEKGKTARKLLKRNLDFDDALICQCMKEKNLKKLISYDSDFDKIDFIDRITPEKLI